MKRIPIAEAKRVAKKYGMKEAILILIEPDNRQHVVTGKYGSCYRPKNQAVLACPELSSL